MELDVFKNALSLKQEIDKLEKFIYELDRSDIHFCKLQTSENPDLESLVSLPLWIITNKYYPKTELEKEVLILKDKIVNSYKTKLSDLKEQFSKI